MTYYENEVRRSAYLAGFQAGESVARMEVAEVMRASVARAIAGGFMLGVFAGSVLTALLAGWLS